MAFRKWILAMFVLALVFTGVASAQVVGEATVIQCQAGTAVLPQIRSEGYTELTGDITLICSGGSQLAPGQLVPAANIVINTSAPVTSRLLGNGGVANASEALLLIDEPGAFALNNLTGIGPQETQALCTTPATGCPAYAGTVVLPNGTSGYGAVMGPTGAASNMPAYNVYQGVVNGANQVTFFGVPILAPVSSGDRVFRITNIRINASGIVAGGTTGFANVNSQVSVNNVPLSVINPTVQVGYVQASFSGGFQNAGNTGALSSAFQFFQCQPGSNAVGILRFSELFGTAFKTRVNGNVSGSGSGYPNTIASYPSAAALQNIPGATYNAESGFVSTFNGFPLQSVVANVGTFTAGLADYGTRLKATFNNIPAAGITVYVSPYNLVGASNGASSPVSAGTTLANTVSPLPAEYAFLVASGETTIDPVTLTTGSEYALTPNAAGTATAVWEVAQALPNATENFDFGVYVTTTNAAQAGASSIMTATLSYAPTPPAVPLPAAAAASATLTIPRFQPGTIASTQPFISINLCETALLFPYVTTAFGATGTLGLEVSGFETGIAISNTSMDPFATTPQSGTCTLNWYGGPVAAPVTYAATAPTTLGAGGAGDSTPIAAGTTVVLAASPEVGPGWSGYMIAVCQFQYAHGYAAVTDVGVRNIMASYLALVIANDTTLPAFRGPKGVAPGPTEQLQN
ncbi:MAG: hypothetical protein ABSE42_06895 [Bryobacteraceae bacterium]|jgi:hypothetical protein